MKIFVTGGAGFIGSALIRLAISRGHTIINIDSLTYAACLENLSSVEKSNNYFFEEVDIRNYSELEKVFIKYNPDSVMHFAAESHVDRSIDNPGDFIQTNIVGTFNMLEVSRHHWLQKECIEDYKFHHISTDEVYGSLTNDNSSFFTESSPYNPRSPYSASKAASDHLVRAWHETYNLPIIITNCSNNYGPFQFPEKLIPVVILNAISEKPIPIYGNGKNIRDWLYVEDHADALLEVLEKGKIGASYNIGGKNEATNIDLVYILCDILDKQIPRDNGKYEELITFVQDRPGHDARYAIDPTYIKSKLGWKPSTSLEQGLEKTVKWYLDNESWWRPLLKRSGVGKRLGKKL
jgi:dTDP-glucose 4,6-dehydratase